MKPAALACLVPAAAQLDGNSDEAKVAPYRLPDPLIAAGGRIVRNPQGWRKRRTELIALFEANIYGVAPRPLRARYIVEEQEEAALGGLAVRRQVTILLAGRRDGPQMRVLLYLPASARGPVSVFLGPNFHGNQAIHPDPAIHITPGWVTPAPGIRKGSATLHSRGIDASEWPVEAILKAGYGVATYFTGDLYPDGDNKVAESIHPRFGTSPSDPQHWGAIATWAWGLSRACDYLATDRAVDAKRIIVFGHSLGSGVAIELATHVEAAGLIVEGAYTGVDRVAAHAALRLDRPQHALVDAALGGQRRVGVVEVDELAAVDLVHLLADLPGAERLDDRDRGGDHLPGAEGTWRDRPRPLLGTS